MFYWIFYLCQLIQLLLLLNYYSNIDAIHIFRLTNGAIILYNHLFTFVLLIYVFSYCFNMQYLPFLLFFCLNFYSFSLFHPTKYFLFHFQICLRFLPQKKKKILVFVYFSLSIFFSFLKFRFLSVSWIFDVKK